MYSSIDELSPNIKSALTIDEQNAWLTAYNSNGSADEAWKSVEASARIFEFIANAEVIDTQNELVKYDALISAMPQYIKTGGPVIDMHSNRVVGTVFGYSPAVTSDGHKAVRCRAAVYKGQKRYDMIWADIKSGNKPAVSIGGDKLQEYTACNDGKCHTEISKLHLYEISVVTNPANPEAVITAVNETAKSILNNVPEGSGKELEKMSEEEESAQAPPEVEDVEKEDGMNGNDVLAQLVARIDSIESSQSEILDWIRSQTKSEDPTEETKEEDKPKTCGCKKEDETMKLRKSLEDEPIAKEGIGKSVAGITPSSGIATAEGPKVTPGSLTKMSGREIEAIYSREGEY